MLHSQNGWKEDDEAPSEQSLAAQLQLAKPSESSASATGVIGSLKRVFEKLKLQYLEEFLEVIRFTVPARLPFI